MTIRCYSSNSSLEPSGSSPSAMTHKTKNSVFSRKRKKKKKAEEHLQPPQEARKVMGRSLTWPKSTRGERKDLVPLLTLVEALCFPYSWKTTRKRKKKRLCFSLCFAKSLSYSLSALVEVGITLSLLAKNKKKKKSCSLSPSLSLFFGPSKKIKEEIAKASPLLVNVKGANDKT